MGAMVNLVNLVVSLVVRGREEFNRIDRSSSASALGKRRTEAVKVARLSQRLCLLLLQDLHHRRLLCVLQRLCLIRPPQLANQYRLLVHLQMVHHPILEAHLRQRPFRSHVEDPELNRHNEADEAYRSWSHGSSAC
jgi:hypothetical protein